MIPRKLSSNINIFTYIADNELTKEMEQRLMTVINGIPFYRSSGKNSHQTDTWFPFRGIDERDAWLMKPGKAFPPPNDILEKGIELQIPDELLVRFGTLETLATSASIGGGFWNSEKGSLLKEYLLNHYPHLILDSDYVTEFKTVQTNPVTLQLKKVQEVNLHLISLGSIVAVNNPLSRLPHVAERKFFDEETIKNNANARQALTMLLNTKCHIDEQILQAIIFLANNNDAILKEALNQYIFENPTQVKSLIDLISANMEKIAKQDLTSINLLATVPSQYQSLLASPLARHALRQIPDHCKKTKKYLKVIKKLNKKRLLEYRYMTESMLPDIQILDVFLQLSKHKLLKTKYIKLMIKLKEKNIFDIQLFQNNEAFLHTAKFLMILKKHNKLNTDGIAFALFVINNQLIAEVSTFFEPENLHKLTNELPQWYLTLINVLKSTPVENNNVDLSHVLESLLTVAFQSQQEEQIVGKLSDMGIFSAPNVIQPPVQVDLNLQQLKEEQQIVSHQISISKIN